MSKLTDAVVVALKAYFETGDQPTAAQFAELIDKIQQGIEEHDHNALGDGDAANVGHAGMTGRTRLVHVPAVHAWSETAGAQAVRAWGGWRLESDEHVVCYGACHTPLDFSSTAWVAVAIVVEGASGNIYARHSIKYGGTAVDWSNLADVTTGWAAQAVVNDDLDHTMPLVPSVSGENQLFLKFERDGPHASDTAGDVLMVGWIFSYMADS